MSKVLTASQNLVNKNMRKIATIATFGGLLFGYDTGVINGSLEFMKRKDQLNLTPSTEGLVSSLLTIGAAIGAVIGGRLADKFGRRKIISLLAFLFIAGTLGCVFAPTTSFFLVMRFCLGLAVGAASVIVPTFLAEIAPLEKRGRIVTQNEFMIVIGQFAAFVFNAILGNLGHDIIGNSIWRYMLVIATLPAIALWLGMMIVPESPRWLASTGKLANAIDVLKQVRDAAYVQDEIDEIKIAIQEEKDMEKSSIKDLKIPWIRRLVLLGIGIGVAQQLSGINVMMYYGTQILHNAGFSQSGALYANIANGLMSALAAGIAMFLMKKIDRRKMYIFGAAGASIAMLLLFMEEQFLGGTSIQPFLTVATTALYIFLFQGTLGPVTWLILSEIFPLRIRGFAMGISTTALWLVNALVGYFFPLMMDKLGMGHSFLVFTFTNLLVLIFAIILLPETRGKTLEQIEHEFKSKSLGTKEQIQNQDRVA
ncbi:MAG: sugar porter family MFS transporter [Clostridiales Family XIII bacterium]|nr:sugar porter family MFS transporter [Clostridiales Family XIII bacterium]